MSTADRPPEDALARLYREQVDVSLLRKNLSLTHEQRLDQLQELLRFAEELRRAGRAARRHEGA
jgi:hypothetical protein